MSQVSWDDSFPQCLRLIFFSLEKAGKEIRSQMQRHLPSKESNSFFIGSWQLKAQSTVPQGNLKKFKVFIGRSKPTKIYQYRL